MDKPKYICISTIKSQYGLNERDIADIDCRFVKNPHYSCAAQMRLYLESDIIEVSHNKVIKTADEKLAEAKEHAREYIQQFVKPNTNFEFEGDAKLPQDIWNIILTKVANDDGIERELSSPSQVAQTIANVARSCKELRGAANTVWCHIKPVNTDILKHDIDWDGIVSEPSKCTVNVLKKALQIMGYPMTGVKAVLIMKVINAFYLKYPVPASASAIFAVVEEKRTELRDTHIFKTTIKSRLAHTELNYITKYTEYLKAIVKLHGTYKKSQDFERDYIKPRPIIKNACLYCNHNIRSVVCSNNCCSQCCGKHAGYTLLCARHRN